MGAGYVHLCKECGQTATLMSVSLECVACGSLDVELVSDDKTPDYEAKR